MPRSSAPNAMPIVIVALVVSAIATGCGGATAAPAGSDGSDPAAPSAARVPVKPTVELTLTGGPAAGTYETDPTASLDLCTQGEDGSWRVLYAGGKPWIQVDALVSAAAGRGEDPGGIALEIMATDAYLWIDQQAMRGGDPKGRSTAVVGVGSSDAGTTFEIEADTPIRNGAEADGERVQVDLTISCPR